MGFVNLLTKLSLKKFIMNPFLLGFVVGFLILFLILGLLRMTIPYAGTLFAPSPIPYKSVKESTEWLNFVVSRVISHFQTEKSINKINEIVNSKIKSIKFRLVSMGNSPHVQPVSTLAMNEPDDVRVLVPINWFTGPSCEVTIGKIRVEFALTKFHGTLLMSWHGENDTSLEIRFTNDFLLNFQLTVEIAERVKFSLTNMPLIGKIIQGFAAVIISRRVIAIDLPAPHMKTLDEED